MKSFSFSDLNRQSGEVLDAALAGPVELTKRGKPKIVMMPVAIYAILSRGRAFNIEDAPDEVIDLLERAIDDAMTAD
jgi:prevent-host-death family protein